MAAAPHAVDMTDTVQPIDVVALLLQHRTLGGAPLQELEWLAAHGERHHADRGSLRTTGAVHPLVLAGLEGLIVLFSGRLVFYGDHGAGPHKLMDWTGGEVSGYLPYSRMSGPATGEMVAADPIDALVVNHVHFPEMTVACPWVTTKLVHVMVDRARHFRASELHDEKMKSLGKLAAGLAHELNNPASASTRSAQLLSRALVDGDGALRTLHAAGLTGAQFVALERARAAASVPAPTAALTAIARADREDLLADWLTARGVDASAAAALADTSIGVEVLDELAATIDIPLLDAAICWLASSCTARGLASDIERATTRISTLVGAVKRFAYMDRALTPEPVAIADSVHDTVILVQEKIRKKSVTVAIDIPPDLPPARAIGSDLNQVLMHVIDNALDASPESGHVTVSAERVADRVIVMIVDNGAGIAPEVRDRIFDAFVTTKPVGQGLGLGLDIARQLVRRNDGDIEVDSTPGRTVFRIVLHVYAAADAESRAGLDSTA